MGKMSKKRFGLAAVMTAVIGLCTGCAMLESGEKDQILSMNQLPPAVKPLAEKEVAGCKIKEVEKETKHGKVVYAITYVDQAGVLIEIEYAENGTLISKGKE